MDVGCIESARYIPVIWMRQSKRPVTLRRGPFQGCSQESGGHSRGVARGMGHSRDLARKGHFIGVTRRGVARRGSFQGCSKEGHSRDVARKGHFSGVTRRSM